MSKEWPSAENSTVLTQEQRDAWAAATTRRVGILTGGAGVGKTLTLGEALRGYRGAIAACAPTGKAAVRLGESLRDAGMGMATTAQTIHRTLRPRQNGRDGEGWGFEHTRLNPINADLVIVDESSMCDASLMSSLLEAIDVRARVLFVGDPGQLPPVGAGKPFEDMIAAGLPRGHLDTPHRNAGRIAQVCRSIRLDEPWDASPKLDLEAEFPENLRIVPTLDTATQGKVILGLFDKFADMGFNPIEDVQVLVGVNRKSPMSREKLNPILQGKLNPRGEQVFTQWEYRVGDKVVCLSNGFRGSVERDPKDEKLPRYQHYVANGEIGTVTGGDNQTGGIHVRFDVHRHAVIPFKRVTGDLSLSYAMTVHRAQGSQYPVVIIPIDESSGANFVCSRSWWYTAISRAAKACILVGKVGTLRKHCKRVDLQRRKTFLTERIEEWLS